MRRSEVEIGVEYAAHGPQAYGRIPQVWPQKVRFTSKDPNHRLVVAYRIHFDADSGRRRLIDQHLEVTKDYADLPMETLFNKNTAVGHGQVGDLVRMVRSHVSGALPAEVWRAEKWEVAMIQPAAVHYTWTEWVEHTAQVESNRRQARVNNAPGVMRRAWSDVVESAHLLGFSKEDLRAWVNSQMEMTVL